MKRWTILALLAGVLSLSACVLGSANLVIDTTNTAVSYNMINGKYYYVIEGYIRNNGTEAAHNVTGNYLIHDLYTGLALSDLVETYSTYYPTEVHPQTSVYLRIEGYSVSHIPGAYTMTVTHQTWSGSSVTVTKYSPLTIRY